MSDSNQPIMKTPKTNHIFIVLVLFFTGFTSCDEYLDVNEDPNRTDVPPIEGLLSNSTYNTGFNVYRLGDISSYFVQYLASPNSASPTDTHQEVNYSTTWFNMYDVMTDLYDLKKLASENSFAGYQGIADILIALNLSMTVDMWGSIPFSQAFTGEILTPSYDDGKSLYSEALALIDEGINLLSGVTESNVEGESDFIHGGDLAAWVKTGYALKARLLNHMSKQAEYDAAAVLAAIDNSYASNEEDAQMRTFSTRNPWAQAALNNEDLLLDGWLSTQLIDAMDGTTFGIEDPRIEFVTDALANGTYVGTPNGAGRNTGGTDQGECYLETSSFYAAEDAPVLIITYSELKFIEAEAALRAGQKARAYSAYLAGISANMEKLGVPGAQAGAYIGHPSVSVGQAALTLDDIFKEKYIAMFLHPETWVDARRYDYQYTDMTLPENHNSELSGFIRRLAYPDTETSRNNANVPQVKLDDRLWWDQ